MRVEGARALLGICFCLFFLVVDTMANGLVDYIIIASDSGRIAILEYMPDDNKFKRVHLETYGKSGIRRVIPGEYLAADPKGRACMIASVEKNKLVYVLNRTASENLTISSPLEAHKPHALVFDLIALDVGYENPVFAALEIDYAESDADPTGQAFASLDKELVYYELDLGLNHVVRKWSEPVDRSANKLFQVPGGADGPSGVLVCSEDFIVYHHSNQYQTRIQIPRRQAVTEDSARKRHVVCGTMHKMRGIFFFLLQTNDGDVFKLTMDLVKNAQGVLTGEVGSLKLKFFDTIPVAKSLCIMKSGFLFAASEHGNHNLYQVMALGDESEDPVFNSEDLPRDFPQVLYPGSNIKYPINTFKPRPFQNIDLASSLDSLHPLMGLKAVNMAYQESPELYAISGTGARSTFRNVRHGLQVVELIAQGLPEQPLRIFTTRLRYNDTVDAYIVLAYQHSTLVLGVGDYIEEISDSGINTSVTTLAIQQMGEDSVIQVFPKGIRHISASGGVNDWEAPQYRSIVSVTTNTQQVAVALSSGHLIYFEMDQDGELNEYGESPQMPAGVTALSMGEVPEGRQRAPFLAVACDDATVRILSLDPEETLESKSVQAISASAGSLCIMSTTDAFSGGSTLYLHIGLTSGVYIRTILDDVTGDLSDTRSRFLGVQPVKLYPVQLPTQKAVLALTSKSWLGYSDEMTRMFTLSPLDYPGLVTAWSFHSDQCPWGIIGVDAKRQLRYVMTSRCSLFHGDHFVGQAVMMKDMLCSFRRLHVDAKL
jgi:splicing factor 3B subunit 3